MIEASFDPSELEIMFFLTEITIRNAWITILIPLEYFDVMHMKSLQKLIPPEFSDVMIA